MEGCFGDKLKTTGDLSDLEGETILLVAVGQLVDGCPDLLLAEIRFKGFLEARVDLLQGYGSVGGEDERFNMLGKVFHNGVVFELLS